MKTRKNSVTYSCACDPGEEMDFRGVIEHIKTLHSEDVEGKPVKMDMINHIDAENWYSWTHKVTTAGGNVFFRHMVCER